MYCGNCGNRCKENNEFIDACSMECKKELNYKKPTLSLRKPTLATDRCPTIRIRPPIIRKPNG